MPNDLHFLSHYLDERRQENVTARKNAVKKGVERDTIRHPIACRIPSVCLSHWEGLIRQ
jgi:hypothetical protein